MPRSAFRVPRLVAGALILLAAPILVRAQQPSSAQIQQALQQNPGLGDVLRQRIQQSGMTPEQIRGRLQAGGYPANLLGAYFGAGGPGQATAQPGALELAARQAPGVQAISLPRSPLPVATRAV